MSTNIKSLAIQIGSGPDATTMTLKGREAWAFYQLIQARESGVTPITHPGPRWSDYVFKLRRRGLVVETVTELHGGVYSGHHARYFLRTPAVVISAECA